MLSLFSLEAEIFCNDSKAFVLFFFSLYKNSSNGARAHKKACTFLSVFSMWDSSLAVIIVITDGSRFCDGEILFLHCLES